MAYRDDREALLQRTIALEAELAQARRDAEQLRADNERLRARPGVEAPPKPRVRQPSRPRPVELVVQREPRDLIAVSVGVVGAVCAGLWVAGAVIGSLGIAIFRSPS